MTEINRYKFAQQIAFDCAKYTEQNLSVGMTEKDTCNLMLKYFNQRDVNDFFHLPFAWFGDRTAFKNFKRPLSFSNLIPHFGSEFMPTNRKLEEGMCVILDVAPIVDGIMVDIGHSFSHGKNLEVLKARKDLLEFRDLILDGVLKNKLMSQIYIECECLLKKLSYNSGHAMYPLGVLGHKLGEINNNILKLNLRRFQLSSYAFLIKNKVNAILGEDKTSGVWNRESNFLISDGIWAVEPHITNSNFGVKFEELLVVMDNSAYWLSDDLPHLDMA